MTPYAVAMSSPLAWYVAGPLVGLAIVAFLLLANRRFGVTGGITDLVVGSSEGRGLSSWRVWLIGGIALGSFAHAAITGSFADTGGYGWLADRLSTGPQVAVLFGAGMLVGYGAKLAGGCTSGHGLTGVALGSRASMAAMAGIMGSAIGVSLLLEAVI